VIKKNGRVLNRLIEYISQSSQESRENMPLLIIDDEADQASVDGNSNDPDSDPTITNERIRTILNLFPRKSYVGYTATPFANVLIDMRTEHAELEDDLYPRNFIVSLPRPENYFGSSQIFNSDLSESYIDEIPNVVDGQVYNERNEILNEGRITDNLAKSIDQFILSCAIRNRRGDRNKPMSMLIHASHLRADMRTVNEVVSGYFNSFRERYLNDNDNLKVEFTEIWVDFLASSQNINETLELDYEFESLDVYWSEVQNVLNVIQILVLNSDTDDRLDYTIDDEIKVIAIGGNQLSRGLTLEGLMISYYLRESRQYDTLLQMGRWFGYRSGYEDLTRIHTTGRIWEFFEHLALVEEELRSEIYRYEEEDLTPAQMAVAIRDHRNLNVTARNKMGAANTRQSSFSGSLNQTIWLPLDGPEVLQSNYSLGQSFIQDVNNQVGFTLQNETNVYISNGTVTGSTVLNEFLRRYNFVDSNNIDGAGMDHTGLIEYIDRRLNNQSPELQEWTIGVVSLQSSVTSDDPVDYGGLRINRLQRSRKRTNRGYNVGVLTDPSHKEVDGFNRTNRPAENGLLLLYLIWSGSEARTNSTERVNLFHGIDSRQIDVLGFAIELPNSRLEPFNYLGQ
jgi:hypothetical protein